jgi:hypothetical protein
MHTQAHRGTLLDTFTHSLTLTHTFASTHTHTHTHTHNHSLPLSLSLSHTHKDGQNGAIPRHEYLHQLWRKKFEIMFEARQKHDEEEMQHCTFRPQVLACVYAVLCLCNCASVCCMRVSSCVRVHMQLVVRQPLYNSNYFLRHHKPHDDTSTCPRNSSHRSTSQIAERSTQVPLLFFVLLST